MVRGPGAPQITDGWTSVTKGKTQIPSATVDVNKFKIAKVNVFFFYPVSRFPHNNLVITCGHPNPPIKDDASTCWKVALLSLAI